MGLAPEQARRSDVRREVRTAVTLRYALSRLGWAVVVAWVVLTAVFAIVAFTRDPTEAGVAFAAARTGENVSAAVDTFRAARNRDAPALARYADFLWDVVRLRLGRSFEGGRPVTAILVESGAVTAAYAVPAVVVSTLLSGVVGSYAALSDSRLFDRLVGLAAYAGLGLPAFWVAVTLSALVATEYDALVRYTVEAGPLSPGNRRYLAFTALVLGTTLFPTQLRHVRAQVDEYARAEFARTARAKGAGRARVARHVVRNALLPLAALFVAELLGLLFLTAFVLEVVLSVPGLGSTLFEAVQRRDLPVVMGVTLVFVALGLAGTLLQDLLRTVLDPRIAD
jgi:peptide/nickel transport system permease protein